MPSPALTPNESPRYRTRKHAASWFKVSPSAIRGWCERGLITAYKHKGRVYVDTLEIEEALKRYPRSVMRDGRGRTKPLPATAIIRGPQSPRERIARDEASS